MQIHIFCSQVVNIKILREKSKTLSLSKFSEKRVSEKKAGKSKQLISECSVCGAAPLHLCCLGSGPAQLPHIRQISSLIRQQIPSIWQQICYKYHQSGNKYHQYGNKYQEKVHKWMGKEIFCCILSETWFLVASYPDQDFLLHITQNMIFGSSLFESRCLPG